MDELPDDVDGGIDMDAANGIDAAGDIDMTSSSPEKASEWNTGLVHVLHAGVIATIGVLF